MITVALMLVGASFSSLAAIGIFRMPDLYTRMHAATKSATLGVGCVLLAVAVHFGKVDVTSRALEVIAFLLLTAPIAAHMIARAAYAVNVPQWDGTVVDELHGHRQLPSPPPASLEADRTAAVEQPVKNGTTTAPHPPR